MSTTTEVVLRLAAGLTRRGWAAALVAGLVVAGLATPAHADTTFAQFDEGTSSGTEPFAFTFNGPGASFSGTVQGNFQFLLPGTIVGPQAATITLSSTAVTAAQQAGPVDVQPITGPTNTLTITRNSDSANLLTVTFTGNLSGLDGDVNGSLSANTALPPQTVTYTSDFLNFSATTSRSLVLTLSNITPGLGVSGTTGFLNNFVTDLTGSFSSSPVPIVTRPIPEPGSVVLFGIGVSATAVVAARRNRAWSAV